MKTSKKSRLLSAMLAILMVVTMFPVTVFAATSETWTKVDLADIKETDTVTITMTDSSGNTYALYNGNGASKAPVAVVCAVSGNTMTAEQSSSDIGWNISNNSGTLIIYKAGTKDAWLYSTNANNGTRVGYNESKTWVIDSASGYLKHEGTGRYLGVYLTNPDWRCYTNTTGNTANQTLGFWKLDSSSGGGNEEPTVTKVATPTASVAPGEVPSGTKVAFSTETDGATLSYSTNLEGKWYEYTGEIEITENVTFSVKASKEGFADSETATFEYTIKTAPTIVDIADALKGDEGTKFTVKGVVTLIDGQNIYLQDATGGICARMSSRPTDISLGDTIIATGSRAVYNGLPQLGSGTYEKSEGLTLSAKETTISALTTADVCTYVEIKNVTITEVYDNNGGYSSPNITVKDSEGKTIQIYKSVIEKNDDGSWKYAIGDKINIKAAVGINNSTLQLRNTLASEITLVSSGGEEPEQPETNIVPISTALAAQNGNFTVKGVVTLIDGQNIYLQDATGGICARMGSKPTDISLGDTVIATGSRAVYNGLPQLGSGTYEKSEGLTLSAKETTISALTTADVCTYVEIKNVTITEIYDDNGKYSNPNITVKDSEGKTIQIYKSVIEKNDDGSWKYAVSDKINIKAAVGIYNSTFQLRNTLASEITEYVELPESGKITSKDQFVTGTYAMVINAGYAMGVLDGSWISSVQPVIENEIVTDAKGGIWTLTVNGDKVTIKDSNGTFIKPVGGNVNGIGSGSYNWVWAFDESKGTFTFSGTDSDTVKLASNKGSSYKFRGYKSTTVSGNPSSYPFEFTLYSIKEDIEDSVLPETGDKVVIYNLSAKGVLAAQNDNVESPSINGVLAEVADGKAVPENGGVVFTVEVNGDYFRFKNETYGYLCSNGTGNNAFYSKEASEDADWKLTSGKKGGYNFESRTAKFNGKYSQFLEYYADSYKTYSMYGDDIDYDIYEFFFYPVAENVNVTEGIVNAPAIDFGTLDKAYIGLDYTFGFTVDSVFGVEDKLIVKAGETELSENEDGTYTIPSEIISGRVITVSVNGTDIKGVAISGSAEIKVLDEPVVENVSPAIGTETKDNKKPVISADIINAGEGAEVSMTVNDEPVDAVYENGKVTYTPSEDLPDGRTTVVISVKRADGVEGEKIWSFTVGETTYQLYFGQLHSHTTYSDGSGSLDSALEYVKGLPESANVDFVAFTDHSNYFDSSDSANPEGALYDMSLATADSQKLWSEYTGATDTFNAEQKDVLALAGFEMTWSGGPGHINTFNTPGIVSRNNKTLNNKTNDAGMKAYYALLSQSEGVDSISQFNHPGSTFGTFSDFAYWDALIDDRIQLVEVGNGEGQVGAGGYYPSYEYYTMALDKGWHVAPTNNQDNHKGKWGNANDARDVILADALTEDAIYEAIRAMRMYSTEDKNLEIGYTVNGLMLGSSIPTDEIPEKLDINVTVYDPDSSDSISKVEVIVNSGKVAYTWDDPAVLATGELKASLNPSYSYYYIRVTEGDGDLAVTAPVWVGESLKLGISSVECGTSTPVTGEEVTITTTLFNSEKKDANVKVLTYTVGSQVIGTDNTGYTLPASGTLPVEFKYTPEAAKLTKVTVTAVVEQNDTEYTFTMDVELDVQNSENLVYIGIDASHYNEYVNGNYKDSMGNFSNLAAEYSIRTVTLGTSSDLIAACSNDKYVALILTAPSRRLAAAQSDPRTYSEAELEAIKAFNEKGGTVIIAGWSDNYENYEVIQSNDAIKHMAETQNDILKALGSSLRIGDDATYDDTYNGGQAYRLYFNTYGDSFLTDGVEVDPEHPHDRLYTEVFSHYGGSTVYTVDGALSDTVTPVVFGHSGTYSVDVDKDGLGGNNVPKYEYAEGDSRLMVMATEQLEGKGLIVVSGAAFMSNFEVQATIEDSGSEKNYSNYKVCENLLEYLNPTVITDISEVNRQTETGYKYTIEGIVTSNASGFDKNTAFFDCIYVQDETGGICCFPVAGNYKIGDKVRITGTTEFYQGEPELQVTSIEVIGEGEIEPTEITAEELNNRSAEGKLVTISGVVESFELANGLVQTIMVKDEKGDVARIFIDGYITTDKDVENLSVGSEITVTGLASYDDTFNAPEGPFPRIRVRDRADVVAEINEDNLIDVVVPGADSNEIHKVLIEEKVEIPENLPEEYKEKYSTTEKIESELERAIYLSNSKFDPNNTEIAFMELTLVRKTANGWVEVHHDDFPEEGIEVCIPYPEGSGIFNDFEVAHLRDDGKIEILNYRKTLDGLVVKVYSLSPFAVAFRENIFNFGSSSGSGNGNGITDILPEKGGNEFNPSTGAPASPASAIAAIIVLSAAALAFGKRK